MPEVIGKLRVATTVAVLLGLLCAFSPLPLRADVLNASNQALAAMMGEAQSDVISLTLGDVPFSGALTFSSQFTNTSFQYSLVSGSLYNGLPISLSTVGALTSPGTWTTTTTGSITGTGTDSFPTIPAGAIRPLDDGTEPQTSDKVETGKDGRRYDVFKVITWTVNPDDASDLLSHATILITNLDNPHFGEITTLMEGDEAHRFADDDGTWQITIDNDFGPGGPGIGFHGNFNPAGNGGFIAQVVPEPSYTLLLASALAGLCMWRCRAFRHSINSLAR